MSLAAKYTKEELKRLPKEIFMQEATFLDMVTDYGQIFSAAYLIRESSCFSVGYVLRRGISVEPLL